MDHLTHTLEVSYLKTLQKLLVADEITVEGARTSAQAFLDMLPFESVDDAQQKLNQYCSTFAAFALLRVDLGREAEQIETNELIEQMRTHLKAGDIDAALRVAQESYD